MTTHVMEGDLVRWLDGEVDAAEGAALEAHVETCADCRTHFDTLRRYDAAWRRAVPLLDTPVAPSWSVRRLAWAATILVLLGVGVGVRPVRAWIVTQGRAFWATVTGSTGGAPAPDAVSPAAPTVGPSRIQFVPAAGAFAIAVEAVQREGALVVERAEGATATAWVEGDGDDADLVVLPDGLRIGNRATARSTYHVVVPRGVAVVTVRVGGAVAEYAVPARVPLGRPGGPGSLQ